MRREQLRVAVVGACGDWGRRYTYAYAHHPDAELIALVDTARDRRQRFAEHYAIPHQFDTVEELLAWQVPDVVANILPVNAARDAVIACARAGVRGISCEKPIAARLADADAMVAACTENGAAFACSTAWWAVHNIAKVGDWVRGGAIGPITGAAIDGFLAHGDQVSGLGCIILSYLRCATGDEVDWVEGWTVPDEAAAGDDDCAAYGALGMSGGYVCNAAPEVPANGAYQLTLFGERGAVFLAGAAGTVLLQGSGARARPVRPAFLDEPTADELAGGPFLGVVGSLMDAVRDGRPAPCSGHDFRQALEIAAALKLSARDGHRRVALPLADRSVSVVPIPYRWHGGDVTGWEVINRPPPSPFSDSE
jgi:predicted dehydrogenase